MRWNRISTLATTPQPAALEPRFVSALAPDAQRARAGRCNQSPKRPGIPSGAGFGQGLRRPRSE